MTWKSQHRRGSGIGIYAELYASGIYPCPFWLGKWAGPCFDGRWWWLWWTRRCGTRRRGSDSSPHSPTFPANPAQSSGTDCNFSTALRWADWSSSPSPSIPIFKSIPNQIFIFILNSNSKIKFNWNKRRKNINGLEFRMTVWNVKSNGNLRWF